MVPFKFRSSSVQVPFEFRLSFACVDWTKILYRFRIFVVTLLFPYFLVLNVIHHSAFINLITKPILNEDDYDLKLVSTELMADNLQFTLYLSETHAILLGIQLNFTKSSLKQVIEKCLRVFDQYKIEPNVAILCTDISPPVMQLLSSTSQNSHWQMMDCTMWAEKFVIISSIATDLHDTEAITHLDPFVVPAIYFSDDENQIQKLLNAGNTTMQIIHRIQQK